MEPLLPWVTREDRDEKHAAEGDYPCGTGNDLHCSRASSGSGGNGRRWEE